MNTLHLQYFAKLREERGTASETVQSAAATPAELYAELQRAHGLTAGRQSLRVAVNETFADWEQALADGDTVVFIQPVAGG
jgi:molybdopterin converting factor subunit 1